MRAALALALGSVMLIGPTLAHAGDDDDNVPFDTAIMRNILKAIGLKRPGEGQINYEERAPLVIPPSDNLPPPQTAGAAIANNPAWPKDPDVERAKLERAREKNRDVMAEVEREENPLPPDQLGPNGKKARARGDEPSDPSGDNNGDEHYRMTPSQLGYTGGLFKNMFGHKDDSEDARFTGEPRRTSLTEPPAGYQTPSPDEPYGLGNQVSVPKAANSYATHGEVKSDSR